MPMKFSALLAVVLMLQGCVVGTAVGVAGDVVEGAANVTVGTVKTTGKVAGAVLPGDGDDEDEDDR
ncbi:MAG: NF038104 family lipoprotein [Pseudomonadota bacterium]